MKRAYRATLAAMDQSLRQPASKALCEELGIPSLEATTRLFESARTVIFDRPRHGLA